MPARITAACVRAGQPAPAGRAQIARCIVDSLALAHRQAVAAAQELSRQARRYGPHRRRRLPE